MRCKTLGRIPMIFQTTKKIAFVLIGVSLAGCSDTLVFMERTSVSIASVNLNENAGEPLELNFGLRRSIVTFAPPVGGVEILERELVPEGDAVSMLSGFQLAYYRPDDESISADLSIATQFVSGRAASSLAMSPKATGELLDVEFLVPVDDELQKRRVEAYQFLGEDVTSDQQAIDALAVAIGEESGQGARDSVRTRILNANEREFKAISQRMEIVLGWTPTNS